MSTQATRIAARDQATKGARYGLWTVLSVAKEIVYPKSYQYTLTCRCDCGTVRDIPETNLRKQNSRSCGCAKNAHIGEKNKTHGLTKTPEFGIHRKMLLRCRDKSFRGYAGRGIAVCERWKGPMGLANFYADMGPRPTPKHSIDRINVDGDYEPSNCRWATAKEQARNKQNTRLVEFRGERKTLTEWSEICGLNYSCVLRRVAKYGWSIEDALSIPRLNGQTRAKWRGKGVPNGSQDAMAPGGPPSQG